MKEIIPVPIPYKKYGDMLPFFLYVMMMKIMTVERRLALFPAGTIARDPYDRESSTRCEQIWTCAEL